MTRLNDLLADRFVMQQIRLSRLGNGVARHIIVALRRFDRQLAQIIAAFGSGHPSGLGPAQLAGALNSAYASAASAIETDLRELGFLEADVAFRIVATALPEKLAVTFARPAPAQVLAAVAQPIQGRTLREWFHGMLTATYNRVRDAIRLGVVEGKPTQGIVAQVRRVLEVDRRGAVAIARTLVNGVSTAARQVTLDQNGSLFSGVQWVSTLDARTTPICQSRDGKVFPLDSGPRPPAHINCRSTIVPVVKGARALGLPPATRASVDGQVAETVTYGEWLKRQPSSVQNEVLGKQRAELFRKGKLTLDRFIDSEGRYYTLEELRRREAKEWRRVFGARGAND